MSLPHHGSEEESELMKILKQQRDNTATRAWPEGRLAGNDDGQIVFELSSDPDTNTVKVDFGKQVEWIGMRPQQAVELAQLLIKHARSISKEPLRVQLF